MTQRTTRAEAALVLIVAMATVVAAAYFVSPSVAAPIDGFGAWVASIAS
jgi:hypothetical protein